MKNLYVLKNKNGQINICVSGECVDQAIEKITHYFDEFTTDGYGCDIFTGTEGYVLKNKFTDEPYYLSYFSIWID